MNKVLGKIAQKVLLIPIVKRGLEKICQGAEIKGQPGAIKEFLNGLAEGQKNERLLDLAEALSWGDVRALEKLVNYVEPRFAEIKGRLEATEHFMAERAKFQDKDNQPDLQEAFSQEDVRALEKLVNMVMRDNIMVAEVGSWKGMSTSVLAKAVAKYHGKVFAVDHWMGTETTWNYEVARGYDIYSIFKKNMILLGLWDVVHPLVMDSQTASQIFAYGILDLVFIDADHRYESVKKDISAWLPKLKPGGILCGHDCEGYYSEYPEEVRKMIDEHLGDDYVSGIHPGVVKALQECFQERYLIMSGKVWYYIKKERDLQQSFSAVE